MSESRVILIISGPKHFPDGQLHTLSHVGAPFRAWTGSALHSSQGAPGTGHTPA